MDEEIGYIYHILSYYISFANTADAAVCRTKILPVFTNKEKREFVLIAA